MKEFKFIIEEVLEKEVEIKANNYEEALEELHKQYYDKASIVLTADNYNGNHTILRIDDNGDIWEA